MKDDSDINLAESYRDVISVSICGIQSAISPNQVARARARMMSRQYNLTKKIEYDFKYSAAFLRI